MRASERKSCNRPVRAGLILVVLYGAGLVPVLGLGCAQQPEQTRRPGQSLPRLRELAPGAFLSRAPQEIPPAQNITESASLLVLEVHRLTFPSDTDLSPLCEAATQNAFSSFGGQLWQANGIFVGVGPAEKIRQALQSLGPPLAREERQILPAPGKAPVQPLTTAPENPAKPPHEAAPSLPPPSALETLPETRQRWAVLNLTPTLNNSLPTILLTIPPDEQQTLPLHRGRWRLFLNIQPETSSNSRYLLELTPQLHDLKPSIHPLSPQEFERQGTTLEVLKLPVLLSQGELLVLCALPQPESPPPLQSSPADPAATESPVHHDQTQPLPQPSAVRTFPPARLGDLIFRDWRSNPPNRNLFLIRLMQVKPSPLP